MKYSRVLLEQTNYQTISTAKVMLWPNPRQLQEIYKKYCVYKKFDSVMPLFDKQFLDPNIDVMCYFDNNNVVAFSLIRRHDAVNAECLQFAWDYTNPKLRLGIESLKHECAHYKALGYKYYYLGGAEEYKQTLHGFEILGPLE